ncbi:2-dehydropantoate 2-reductase [Nibricoccus aquaticus]|uniref:2-dehydropantoate 2-reductase n=1 Tax=Nibricoccus aquaticus TaxID=2576891 RepID=A0A290Q8L2_9BACT|nr:2-dehydropantoate 2-reductase [Nibricoccus aquaticus]ATC62566.1 2-dehydropantoate 2-reductase [Nibricoccus aquaticus]
MKRIAIVGPGAVGGVVAGWLAHTGRHEVILCSRRPLPELVVELSDRRLTSRPLVFTDPAQATPVDWILVTTKAYDVPGAALWIKNLGPSGAPVAVLQNGVEHRERFAPYLSADRIVPVVVDCPAERVSPTHIRQRGPAKMAVSDDLLGQDFAALFANTAVDVTLTADFKTAVWRKLCLNTAGVISALIMKPSGVMHDAQLGELSLALVRECIVVGRAEGAVLPDDLAEAVLQNYRNAPPDSVNSLHGDRIAGRPTELDARNGAVVRFGRKHGIPTPCNQMAVALLAAMSS